MIFTTLLSAMLGGAVASASGGLSTGEWTAQQPGPVAAARVALTAELVAQDIDPDSVLDGARWRVTESARGATVVVHRVVGGLPTQDPDGVVFVDHQGVARIAVWRPKAVLEGGPILSAGALEDAVLAAVDVPVASVDVGPVRWGSVATGTLQPGAEVTLPAGLYGMTAPVAWVDARTGALLDVRDGAVSADGLAPGQGPAAWIYEWSPVLDDGVVQVDLSQRTTRALASDRAELRNCVDRGDTEPTETVLGWLELRVCTRMAPEVPEGGAWLFEPVPWPEDSARDNDAFAGPHLLWHIGAVLDDFEAMGLPLDERPREWQRLLAVTNQRTTDLLSMDTATSPGSALEPYDNAYFRSGRELSDGEKTAPEIVFGQGTLADFAYDVDVISHELGHFAVWTQGGPSYSQSSRFGSTVEPGALNEGLADYFAAVRAGEPEVGEYTGESLGRPYIRTLDGAATCADTIIGQVHNDSQPFSQALWTLRSTLDATDGARMDAAVMDALPLIGRTGGFAEAVEAVLAQVALEDADWHAVLEAEFAARGVDRCDPVVAVASGAEARRYTQVPGDYGAPDGETPGHVQFVIDEDGPLDVVLTFSQSESTELDIYGRNAPGPLSVLHKAGGPLVHSVQSVAEDTVAWVHDGAVVAEAQAVPGSELTVDERSLRRDYEARFRIEGAGPHHLQLTNGLARTATAIGPVFSWSAAPAAPVELGEGGSGAGPAEDKGGCAVATAGVGVWGLWLVGLGVAARRRDG